MNTRRGRGRTLRPRPRACAHHQPQTYRAPKARVGSVERTGPQAITTDFDAAAPAVHRRSCTHTSVGLSRRTRGAAYPSATTADSGRVTHTPRVGHAAVTFSAPAPGYAPSGLHHPRTDSATTEPARDTRRTQ